MDETNSPNSITNAEITNVYNSFTSVLMQPVVILILIGIIVIYVIIFMSLGSSKENSSSFSIFDSNTNTNSQSDSSSYSNILLVIVVIVFIILIIVNGIQYFYGTDIVATVKNIFSNTPEIDINVDSPNPPPPPAPVPEIKLKKQVFNIPGNTYDYPDAQALCSAYGGRLANYKEMEQAYSNGAEWCNYGWSDGQMALFPTQQSTFDGLQKIEGHEHDCGRPGINGGYMANPKLKFGVNCFGYKPVMTSQEEELMQNMPHYPQTAKDLAMEQRVSYWKDKLDQILVSPFNYNNWSKI